MKYLEAGQNDKVMLLYIFSYSETRKNIELKHNLRMRVKFTWIKVWLNEIKTGKPET